MQIEDDDPVPATGKLKGGPKKVPDVKPSKAKAPAFKAGSKSGGGKSGGFKAGKAGKISAKIGHTKVQAHGGSRKAGSQFNLPRPALPKKKGKR